VVSKYSGGDRGLNIIIHSHTDTEVKKNKDAKLQDNTKGTEQTQYANHFWVSTYGYA